MIFTVLAKIDSMEYMCVTVYIQYKGSLAWGKVPPARIVWLHNCLQQIPRFHSLYHDGPGERRDRLSCPGLYSLML